MRLRPSRRLNSEWTWRWTKSSERGSGWVSRGGYGSGAAGPSALDRRELVQEAAGDLGGSTHEVEAVALVRRVRPDLRVAGAERHHRQPMRSTDLVHRGGAARTEPAQPRLLEDPRVRPIRGVDDRVADRASSRAARRDGSVMRHIGEAAAVEVRAQALLDDAPDPGSG